MLEAVLSPKRIVSVAEMQALERRAAAAGHSYAAMMEAAGRAVASVVWSRYGAVSYLVLAGPGHNGGDGLVCADCLRKAGAHVQVYLWKRPAQESTAVGLWLAKLGEAGVAIADTESDPSLATLRAWLQQADVLVDALLGTGANRPVTGPLAAILAAARTAQAVRSPAPPIVAVDCASGINCDTGDLDPHTLFPDLTVTFACAKVGHYQFPAAAAVGELFVADIGIDPAWVAEVPTFVLEAAAVRAWLPSRPSDSHKGTFGRVLLVVGSEAYPGAALLARSAAGRAGAGLVTVATIRSVWAQVAGRLPEPTWLLLPAAEGVNGAGIASTAAEWIAPHLSGCRALVVGCGLNQTPETHTLLAHLLDLPLPATVFDADGLNGLAALEHWVERLPAHCVLTPHPAEMARLCGRSVAEVTAHRWALARQKAEEWQCTVLLKGPYTVVASSDGQLAVLPIATAALATAGSGDILAGLIGGLLAQGSSPFAAACLGAWLHGQAGLHCAATLGEAGVVASDLLPLLPLLQRQLRGAPRHSSAVHSESPDSRGDANRTGERCVSPRPGH